MEGDNGASEQLRTPLLPENAMDNINATSNTSSDGDDANCPDVSSTAAAADGIMRTTTTTTTTVGASDNNNNDSGWFLSNPQQLTAMLSNYSTSYNVVNISLVLPILEELYDGDSEDAAACASSLLAGMIIGQLVGGALGDSMLGRLGALRLVMALQLIASLASASVTGSSGDEIYVKLALWRFILGVGAGGVYPLAAVLSAEQSMPSSSSSNSNNNNDDHDDKSSSVHRVVLTFSTQGAGFVTVPIVAVILLHTIQNLNLIWRIMLGLGSIPGIILMILQWRLYSSSSSSYHTTAALQAVPLEEPPTTTEAVEDEDTTPAADTFNDDNEEQHNNNDTHTITLQEDEGGMSQQQQQQQRVGWLTAIRNEPGLGRKVIGTAGTWFLFDVVFYGNAIFQPIVVEAAFGGRSSSGGSSLELLRQAAMDTLILTSIALPGYAVAGLVIGKKTCCVTQTPRYVMLQGFAAMSVLYVSIGLNWSYLRHSPALLVFLYGMTFFFANYGPNTCTFILPSLLYSPECRSTWNGISAASGKLGALLGATLFAPAADEWGDNSVMLICAGLAVLAFVLTYCFVPKEGEEEIIINRSIVATEEEEHERSDDRSSPLNEADRWT